MTTEVLIRADGGPSIGFGHLVRTGALAESLLSLGHEVTCATTTPMAAREVHPDSVDILELPTRDDPTDLLDRLVGVNPDVILTDAYPIDTAYQRRVRDHVPLAVLQDDARHAICADLFVNPNLYATELSYAFVGPEPTIKLGPEYLLLGQEIRQYVSEDPPWRSPPERALITFGGSDSTSGTPVALRAFDGMDLRVDVIVGPGFSERNERDIHDTANAISADVRVAKDPDDLAERMFQADVSVSAASTTTYELLALGTPIVSQPVVDNQMQIAASLREGDLAIVLERDAGPTDVRREVKRLVQEPDRRRAFRNRGRTVVDDRGVERVVTALLEVATTDRET